jgi:hypothetical protein
MQLVSSLYRSPPVDIDQGARNIHALAKMARSMPPSWLSHADSFPIRSQEWDYLGEVLPGTGIYLNCDLKDLGITKKIPYVVDRSELGWGQEYIRKYVREKLWAAISSYDGIISGRANGTADDPIFSKVSLTTVANAWSSLWQVAGTTVAGTYTAIPGGAAPDHTTPGSMDTFMSKPASGNKYLLTFGFTSAQQLNMVLLHDLLVAAGSISTTVATAQTVNTTALTRYITGVGVLITFDISTALGASAANITVNSYTNTVPTSGKTTAAVAMTPSAIAARLQPVALGPFMALAAGDVGVTSIQQVTLSATMAAGVIALNLYKPLSIIPGIAANIYAERDSTTQIDGLVQLQQNASAGNMACVNAYILPNTTSTGIMTGSMRTVSG